MLKRKGKKTKKKKKGSFSEGADFSSCSLLFVFYRVSCFIFIFVVPKKKGIFLKRKLLFVVKSATPFSTCDNSFLSAVAANRLKVEKGRQEADREWKGGEVGAEGGNGDCAFMYFVRSSIRVLSTPPFFSFLLSVLFVRRSGRASSIAKRKKKKVFFIAFLFVFVAVLFFLLLSPLLLSLLSTCSNAQAKAACRNENFSVPEEVVFATHKQNIIFLVFGGGGVRKYCTREGMMWRISRRLLKGDFASTFFHDNNPQHGSPYNVTERRMHDDEFQDFLASVTGWTVLENGAIQRVFQFEENSQAYAFMGRLMAFSCVSDKYSQLTWEGTRISARIYSPKFHGLTFQEARLAAFMNDQFHLLRKANAQKKVLSAMVHRSRTEWEDDPTPPEEDSCDENLPDGAPATSAARRQRTRMPPPARHQPSEGK